MRTIKFRLWCGGDSRWVDTAWLLDGDSGKTLDQENYCYHKEGHILEQFTGLRDKKGKEIYEGDLVRCEGDIDEVVFGKVGYDGSWNGLTGFALKRWWYEGNYELCYHFDTEDIEVIGNIHQNKDLLDD